MKVKEAIEKVTTDHHNIEEITIFKNYKILFSGSPKDYTSVDNLDILEAKYVEVYNFKKIFIFI